MATSANATHIIFGDGTTQNTAAIQSFSNLGVNSSNTFDIVVTPTIWYVNTYAYVRDTKLTGTGAGSSDIEGIYVRDDGLKMYTIWSTNDKIQECDLSEAYNVASRTIVANSTIASSNDTVMRAITFKPDGTKMYCVGNGDTVFEYGLSTPWSISSASYHGQFLTLGSTTSGIDFKPDGTKMYTTDYGLSTEYVREHTLSTPWSVNTASVTTTKTLPSSFEQHDVKFSNTGARMYVLDNTTTSILEYNLSTPWNISTATILTYTYTANSAIPKGMSFAANGTHLYILDDDTDTIRHYYTGYGKGIRNLRFTGGPVLSTSNTNALIIS